MPTALELLPHQRAVIRTDGTVEPFEHRTRLEDITRAVHGFTHTVNLRDGRVMMCDDMGVAKGLPRNVLATQLYWSICRPGTSHPILGDVIVFPDADFGTDDDFA